jgi:Raf kinase inhibitor-like YbhB/YbcL family protein
VASQDRGHVRGPPAVRCPAADRGAPRRVHAPILTHHSGQDGAIPTSTLRRLVLFATLGLLAAACSSAPKGANAADDLDRFGITESLVVSSPAFGEGETIPSVFTCRGDGTSPPLAWQGVPEGAAELAIVVDDPDAPGGTYVHWIVTGLAPTTVAVDAGKLPDGAHQASNSAGKAAYTPPCPPKGEHRYRFTVYALSSTVTFADGASTDTALKAIKAAASGRGRISGRVAA